MFSPRSKQQQHNDRLVESNKEKKKYYVLVGKKRRRRKNVLTGWRADKLVSNHFTRPKFWILNIYTRRAFSQFQSLKIRGSTNCM